MPRRFLGHVLLFRMVSNAGCVCLLWRGQYGYLPCDAHECGLRSVVQPLHSHFGWRTGIENDEPYSTLTSAAPPPSNWAPVTKDSPTRPRGLYACTKLWGESLGRMFVSEFRHEQPSAFSCDSGDLHPRDLIGGRARAVGALRSHRSGAEGTLPTTRVNTDIPCSIVYQDRKELMQDDECDFATRDKNIWCSARDCVIRPKMTPGVPGNVPGNLSFIHDCDRSIQCCTNPKRR